MLEKFCCKRVSKIFLVLILVLCFFTLSGFGWWGDGAKYEKALKLFSEKKYDDAIATFSEIEMYEDSSIYIMYIKALKLVESGQYSLAASTFETMSDFKDCKYLSIYCKARQAESEMRYEDAAVLYQSIITYSDSTTRMNKIPDLILKRDFDIAAEGLYDGKYSSADAKAIAGFIEKEYSDSKTRMLEDVYEHANSLLKKGDYTIAYELFTLLSAKEFGDSITRIQDCHIAHVQVLMADRKYDKAYNYLVEYVDFTASVYSIFQECAYNLGFMCKDYGQYADAYIVFGQAGDYLDAQEQAKAFETEYATANDLFISGKYMEAYALFHSLYDYSDSASKATECYYQAAVEMLNTKQYDAAISAFEALGDYSNSTTMLKESYYQKANALNRAGQYKDAFAIYSMLSGYSDTDNILRNDENIAAERRATFVVGNTVSFGRYEQDADKQNGPEPIEWIVLKQEDNTFLLVSKSGLDSQVYHRSEIKKTWETCYLRGWLNDEFMNSAFNSEEQQALVDATITNRWNKLHSTNAGNDTTDKVFLLSVDEAKELFDNDRERRTTPTKYAIEKGAGYNPENCWYWLRSPGWRETHAARVTAEGTIDYHGYNADAKHVSVRPAIYIDINKMP